MKWFGIVELKKLNKDIDYIMDWYKIIENEAIRA